MKRRSSKRARVLRCMSNVADKFDKINKENNPPPKMITRSAKKARIQQGHDGSSSSSSSSSVNTRARHKENVMFNDGKDRLTILDDELLQGVVSYLEEDEACGLATLTCKKMLSNAAVWSDLLSRVIGNFHPPGAWNQNANTLRVYYQRRKNEFQFQSRNWLTRHSNLRQSFFPILSNWLPELHFELFGSERSKLVSISELLVIHRAVRYLFKFLCQCRNISRSRLQLVGLSCYQIAVNTLLDSHEIQKFDLTPEKYAYYTDDTYTAEEVTAMTSRILHTLGFKLNIYTPKQALVDLCKMVKLPKLTKLFAHYYVDLAVYDITCGEYLPSMIAVAALKLACKKTNQKAELGAVYNEFVLGCHSTSRCAKVSEKLTKLYTDACNQEADETFDLSILPKQSAIIRHYRDLFIECVQGSLIPECQRRVQKLKKQLFLSRGPKFTGGKEEKTRGLF